MRQLSVPQIDTTLDRTPVVFEGEPLLLAELDNLVVERNVRDYVLCGDSVGPIPPERVVILGPTSGYYDRWPAVTLEGKLPGDLKRYNRRLFQHYDQVRRYAFKQTDIAAYIEDDLDVDVVVLLLIDGLSFADWVGYPNVRSCLVEGPSITPVGFRNIVNRPSIAQRLFRRKFRKRLGFAYWDRNNELTNILFHGFDPSTQMFRVDEFKEALLALDHLSSEQTYVQIVVNGLDSVCHHHRERPAVAATARHLFDNVLLALVEKLHRIRVSALVYAVADHGILWKPEPGASEDFVVVGDERVRSNRYAKGAFIAPNSLQFTCYDQNYTVLAYPYLFNRLSSLEWGTHGGISFQESVVPFVKWEVI